MFGKKKEPKRELTRQEETREEIDDIMSKYKKKLKTQLEEPEISTKVQEVKSVEYNEFKAEYMPRHMTWYETACNLSEKIIKMAPDPKKVPDYEEAIEICHLNITPTGVISLSILAPLCVMLFGGLISFVLIQSMFFVVFFLIFGMAMIGPMAKVPKTLANNWRMKSSNQMVLCVFYVVTYMRHTSNLELAVEFASDHLAPPMAVDLKKVLWNVETEKYESIKEALDIYLETWKKWNMEFIESFHLIESSLYEGSEDRRINMLDKSLDVILDETYEKMLHYAQNLNSPITMLHMLGVILPILGMVILPLVVSFMCQVHWYHLFAMYNLGLPIGVYYLGKNILMSRPTGYGDTDISEENPDLKKFRNMIIKVAGFEIKINPIFISVFVGVILVIIGISPMILHVMNPEWDIVIKRGGEIAVINAIEDPNGQFYFLGYIKAKGCEGEGEGEIVGPYGLGASLLSLMMGAGVGASLGTYYKLKSKNIIEIRNRSKELEKEFASALFQLGNRLGDGLPVEIAFSKVSAVMEGTISGKFFDQVSSNIRRMGMGVEQAIFDPHHGAMVYYPSNLIESSMKVLTVSSKKGPRVAAQALINVSRYIKEIHRVNERLKDLLAETISSMTSQIKFLTPIIAGIVIGITSMITTIINKIGSQVGNLAQTSGGAAQMGAGANLVTMFSDGVPTFYFQVVIGFYVIQIVYILTVLTVGIENGSDKLAERYNLGVNLMRSTILYTTVAFLVILAFNVIAGSVIGSMKLG